MRDRFGMAMLISAALLLSACSESGPPRKATFPVTGQVLVDGKPAAALEVTMHDVNGMDPKQPTLSSTYTDDSGKFSLSTYEEGDGVPEGEYLVSFQWGEVNLMTRSYGGPDKLKNRYTKEKSKFRIKVEKGKPTDMGMVKLTTK